MLVSLPHSHHSHFPQRLDHETRTHVQNLLSETLSGLVSIRALDTSTSFILENERRLDVNHRAYWNMMMANRWLGLRLEFVGSVVVFFAGLFIVIYKNQLSAGLTGLSLMYALSLTHTLNWLVRTVAEVDVGLAAAYRVKELANLPNEMHANVDVTQSPSQWPTKGKVAVQGLVVRRSRTQQVVLKCTAVGLGG